MAVIHNPASESREKRWIDRKVETACGKTFQRSPRSRFRISYNTLQITCAKCLHAPVTFGMATYPSE